MKGIKSHKLRVFLCHSSGDKPIVREIYEKLRNDRFEPWLDEKDLLPGQNWQHEIPKAVRNSDVILVCLSRNSVSKSGYVQKEIRLALEVADEQPEGTIFLIPLKLEECESPEQLKRLHWVNLYEDGGYEQLGKALLFRATALKELQPSTTTVYPTSTSTKFSKPPASQHQLLERELKTYQWISPPAPWIVIGVLLVLSLVIFFLRARQNVPSIKKPTLSIKIQPDGIEIKNTNDYSLVILGAHYAIFKFDKALHNITSRSEVVVSDLISDNGMLASEQISGIQSAKLLARSDSIQNGVSTSSDKLIIHALVIAFRKGDSEETVSEKTERTFVKIEPFSVIREVSKKQDLLFPLSSGKNSETLGVKPEELIEILKKINAPYNSKSEIIATQRVHVMDECPKEVWLQRLQNGIRLYDSNMRPRKTVGLGLPVLRSLS